MTAFALVLFSALLPVNCNGSAVAGKKFPSIFCEKQWTAGAPQNTILCMVRKDPAKENRELVHRLNRIIGQLQSMRKRLETGENDCSNDVQQLKAASQALIKFTQSYIEEHMKGCMQSGKTAKEVQKDLQSVIHAFFSF